MPEKLGSRVLHRSQQLDLPIHASPNSSRNNWHNFILAKHAFVVFFLNRSYVPLLVPSPSYQDLPWLDFHPPHLTILRPNSGKRNKSSVFRVWENLVCCSRRLPLSCSATLRYSVDSPFLGLACNHLWVHSMMTYWCSHWYPYCCPYAALIDLVHLCVVRPHPQLHLLLGW